MNRLIAALTLAPMLAACTWDGNQAARDCAGTAGCISSLPPHHYGPIHAQAAAPPSLPANQPQ